MSLRGGDKGLGLLCIRYVQVEIFGGVKIRIKVRVRVRARVRARVRVRVRVRVRDSDLIAGNVAIQGKTTHKRQRKTKHHKTTQDNAG